MKSTTLLWLFAALWLPLVQSIGSALDFSYTTSNGQVTIAKYTGPGGDVSIPREINGKLVTGIGHGAFFSCSTVLTLGIPESVTNIADIVFSGCTGLNAISVDPANPAYSSVEGILFDKAQAVLVRCPQCKAGSYVIPDTVNRIMPYAFDSCADLVSITLPESVTSIGEEAFYWCTSLRSIVIPPGVCNIEGWTFAYASSLTDVTIRGSVTNIGDWAFYQSRLFTLTVPDTLVTLGAHTFSGNYFMTNIIMGTRLASIGHSAFDGDSSLRGVYFRGNAPAYGTNVFGTADLVTVYYLPGAAGWEETFAERPTALWLPRMEPSDLLDPDAFGFDVIWTPGMQVEIETSDSLSSPSWLSLSTNILTTSAAHFADPDSPSHPSRFYRVRSP